MREQRIAALRARPTLTDADHAELRRLEQLHDRLWADLPRRIDRARAKLKTLTAYAEEIGLGPC
ncbi:MAG: hypothetical protein P0Y64_01960 [Candidatus Sphingomonas colombiensis]|nr:hypothetical protein [Sphingomonas sp.]WEK43620.1 MAG: hypothetical protein P0Y64_01960 [Sphingomonas sp.]